MCFIAYSVYDSEKISDINTKNIKQTSQTADKTADKKTDPNSSDHDKPLDLSDIKSSGNIIEKTATKVIQNVASSKDGKAFLEKLLTPENQFNIYRTISVHNFNPQYEIYGIKTQHDTPIANNKKGVICGNKIQLEVASMNESIQYKSIKQEEYIVGQHQDEMFNIAPIGMEVGEVRKITKPKNKNDNKMAIDHSSHVMVKLNANLSVNDSALDVIKIFDDYLSPAMPVMCGRKVKFTMRATNLLGEHLFTTTIKYKVGDNTYPTALSKIMCGKPHIGTRTAILPEYLLCSPQHKDIPCNMNSKNFIMVEFYDADTIVN
jgi:hypothetical protein